jgi:hypothetical protein
VTASPWTRRAIGAGLSGIVVVLFLGIVSRPPFPVSPDLEETDTGPVPKHLLVLTYFFYWYDAATGAHLNPDTLALHPTPTPPPSWRSVAWYEQELSDMADAGIDVVLPVYWGSSPEERWSTAGLADLVRARDRLADRGVPVPRIGMFFDTTIVRGLDLTSPANIRTFYATVRGFYRHIPRRDWGVVRSRPIVWLFIPQENTFDRRVFDDSYRWFERDFGVRPYIVRASSWDCPVLAHSGFLGSKRIEPDCSDPIRTEASYVWGAAQHGFQETETVATVGPGYDERAIPGRSGLYRARDGGDAYRRDLAAALASGRKLLAIETWNEFHEASAIAESTEYGRTYIDITRTLLGAGSGPPR